MSSIQVAKLGMGYQTATKRPSCKNCKHVGREFVAMACEPFWRCKKAGFNTSAMAICNQHEPKLEHEYQPINLDVAAI